MTPIEWLLSGDTGVSSKTICAVMTGSNMGGHFWPDVPALLEQIANEPPINGNAMAQARILMKAAKLRASAPQADRSGCTAGSDEECKHQQCATQCPKRAQIGQGAPVAWKHDCAVLLANDVELWVDACPHCGKPRHHPAPQQKPLTDEQINQMWSDAHNDTSTMSLIHVLARTIEAAHGIK